MCSRFEIDRSKRVYHGALIDCELLGEVYLAMTRGQFSLADSFAESAAEAAVSRQPRPAVLKVIRAEAAEIAEHEAYLDALDKAGGGPCAWRAQAGGESA